MTKNMHFVPPDLRNRLSVATSMARAAENMSPMSSSCREPGPVVASRRMREGTSWKPNLGDGHGRRRQNEHLRGWLPRFGASQKVCDSCRTTVQALISHSVETGLGAGPRKLTTQPSESRDYEVCVVRLARLHEADAHLARTTKFFKKQ